jgi:hypothetical protein
MPVIGKKPEEITEVEEIEVETIPTLLSQLPNKITGNDIPYPVNSNSEDKEIKVYKASAEPSIEKLNVYLPIIKNLLSETNFNFTRYKAKIWQEEMKVSEAIAYELSLLIPDIVSPPLYDLGFKEHPHLGVYLWGVAGGLRTTIGEILQEQWLYSFILSEAGFDSDVGILWALSHANRDLILIGSDIGSATVGLKDWQRKLPSIIVNFIWDGREVRTIKEEGTIEVLNNGVSFYGGGNKPLGQSEFTVKDVSRIIQNEMPAEKSRNIELMARRLKGKTKLDRLIHPVIIYTHYLNALIMQGRIKLGVFSGKKVEIDIDESIKKKIAGHIIRNYIPKIAAGMSDEEIWEKMEEIKNMTVGFEEDTNAILRVLTMALMIVRDSAIDNLLLRPYEIKDNTIHIKATEDDLTPLYRIMDSYFWEMRRYEFKFARLYEEVTPTYLKPHLYYYELLKQFKVAMSAKRLYNLAKDKLIEEGKLSEEEFRKIYGEHDALADNYKLQKAIEQLERIPNVAYVGTKPKEYIVIEQ